MIHETCPKCGAVFDCENYDGTGPASRQRYWDCGAVERSDGNMEQSPLCLARQEIAARKASADEAETEIERLQDALAIVNYELGALVPNPTTAADDLDQWFVAARIVDRVCLRKAFAAARAALEVKP